MRLRKSRKITELEFPQELLDLISEFIGNLGRKM